MGTRLALNTQIVSRNKMFLFITQRDGYKMSLLSGGTSAYIVYQPQHLMALVDFHLSISLVISQQKFFKTNLVFSLGLY